MPKETESTTSASSSAPAPSARALFLKVRRQDALELPETRRWEVFRIPLQPRMSVIGALREVQKNPVTSDGRAVPPVVWESSCLEEVCGACTMVVNGRVRQACSAILSEIAGKANTVVLEPLAKFPLVRDLVVDRSKMFEDLKKVRAWVALDGTQPRRAVLRQSPESQRELYALSRCMTCGCCLEACPEYGPNADFVGAPVLNQVRLLNVQPTGQFDRVGRLEAVMGPGGIADCGKAQNCVEVCPVKIPLVDSIQHIARQTTQHLIGKWILG